jgi:hypothetical protein
MTRAGGPPAPFAVVQFKHGNGAQQYRETVSYTFHCATCDKPITGEFGPLWYDDSYPVEDTEDLEQAAWLQVGVAWCCQECSHMCWEGDEEPQHGTREQCFLCSPQPAGSAGHEVPGE